MKKAWEPIVKIAVNPGTCGSGHYALHHKALWNVEARGDDMPAAAFLVCAPEERMIFKCLAPSEAENVVRIERVAVAYGLYRFMNGGYAATLLMLPLGVDGAFQGVTRYEGLPRRIKEYVLREAESQRGDFMVVPARPSQAYSCSVFEGFEYV